MPLYSCIECNFTTKLKSNYSQHLKTKKHKNNTILKTKSHDNHQCIKINSMMSQNEPKMSQNEPKMSQNEPTKSINFICEFCKETFNTKPNLRRHQLHRCKMNTNETLELKVKIREMEKKHEIEKKKLYKKIEELLEKVGDKINNNNCNNITNSNNTINNNIHINNYGNEDLSHLTPDVLTNLIKGPCSMISDLTKMIHFNEDKPQNMNIFIPNKRGKYIKIFKDDEWTLEDKKERIPDIVDKNYNILDNHFENNEDYLENNNKKNYKKIQNSIDANDKTTIQKNCDLVELEILNGSEKHKSNFIKELNT